MNEFEFPLTTEYHPNQLVMDEHSLERTGWFGAQTMVRPKTLFQYALNFPPPVWGLLFKNHDIEELRASIVGNDAYGRGYWHHGGGLIAYERPYGYVRIEQVHTFELEGRTGDYTIVRRVFVALRDDGRLDIISEPSASPNFGFTQPQPPTLTDNHVYTDEQLVEWEEAYLVAVAVPKPPVPPLVSSPASNLVRILRDPTAYTYLDIELTHPDPTNHDYFTYLFVGGQSFFIQKHTSTFTQIGIPPNEILYKKGVQFRFFANNRDTFNANGEKITGILSLGNRMVYWGRRGVYISSKNFAFMFGTEEGYTPQEGDGGFVSLPNVLWCTAIGSTLLAFTPKKVFRIVEAGQGVWVAIETDFIPPLVVNNKPIERGHLYRSSATFVDISSGEAEFFGFRFRLLDLKQITGTKELGMGVDGNKDVWVWNGEDIYKMPNETADFVFTDAGKFILLSSDGDFLYVKEWEPVGWSVSGGAKYTNWRYIKSFPSEVYFEYLIIRLMGMGSVNANILIKNFDVPTQWVETAVVLKPGLNKIILPKRLRAAVFDIEVEAGSIDGTADYKLQIMGGVRALERIKGGLKR